ncbi:hypothetical protein BV22DRAFT_440559 [Leucogyrophana mollusca]|uniref:Uncharacterized protein n=1 Tax=Leucogyrophana mollusca TaxID=85980 RepID=A0ACB8BHW6_9AGAM|nr:hypothetical protein BV22DRAFT_440559 [Leucogyrophana mollusca]
MAVFLVLGEAGAGKSTFINYATGATPAAVGHNLESCTKSVESFTAQHPTDPNRRVTLIDTPGFNDTWLEDGVTLKTIVDWLSCHKEGTELTGIIYLHDIKQPRAENPENPTDLMTPNKLCYPGLVQYIVLTTTKWVEDSKGVGPKNEAELTNVHWKTMLRKGSHMARFTNTHESAWDVLSVLLQKDPVDGSLIQRELTRVLEHLPKKPAKGGIRGFFSRLFGG